MGGSASAVLAFGFPLKFSYEDYDGDFPADILDANNPDTLSGNELIYYLVDFYL